MKLLHPGDIKDLPLSLLLLYHDWDCTEKQKLSREQQNQHVPQAYPAHHPPSCLWLRRSCSSAQSGSQGDAHQMVPTRPRAGYVAPWSYLVCTNQSPQKCLRPPQFNTSVARWAPTGFHLQTNLSTALTCCCTAHLSWADQAHSSGCTLQMTSSASPTRDCCSSCSPILR